MKTLPINFLPPTAHTSTFATVDLDDARALQLARSLAHHMEEGRRHFLVDCETWCASAPWASTTWCRSC